MSSRHPVSDLTILFKSMQRNIDRVSLSASNMRRDECLFRFQLSSANTSNDVPQEDSYTGAAHKMAVIKELMKSVVDIHLENLPHKTAGFTGVSTPL